MYIKFRIQNAILILCSKLKRYNFKCLDFVGKVCTSVCIKNWRDLSLIVGKDLFLYSNLKYKYTKLRGWKFLNQ